MKKKKRLYIVLGILVLLTLVYQGVLFYIEPILENRLHAFLDDNPDLDHVYDFERIKLNMVTTTLEVVELTVKPKETTLDSLKDYQRSNVINIENANIIISGVPVWKYFFSKELIINEIIIENPKVKVYFTNKSESPGNTVLMQEIFSNLLNKGEIKRFRLNQATFEVFDIDKKKPLFFTDSVFVLFENALVDKNTLQYMMGMDFEKMALNSAGFKIAIDSNYTIASESIFIQAFSSKNKPKDAEAGMFIKKFSLNPDEDVLKNLNRSKVRSLTKLTVENVKLEELEFEKFFQERDLRFKSFVLEKPVVNEFVNTKSREKANPDPIGKKFENFLARLNFERLVMSDAKVTVRDINKKEPLLYMLDTDLEVQGLQLSADDLDEKSINPAFEKAVFDADSISSMVSELYILSGKNLVVNAKNRSLDLKKLYIKPVHSKTEYQKHIPTEKDWFSGDISDVKLKGFNLDALYNSLSVYANSLSLNNLDLHIYRDKSLPDNTDYKALPQQLLKDLPFNLGIDTLHSTNMEITYEQVGHAKNEELPGKATLDQMTVWGYNITNAKQYIRRNPVMTLNMDAMLFRTNKLRANYNFYLNDYKNKFTLKGDMQACSARTFSPLMESMMLIKVSSGYINDFKFNFTANEDQLTGSVRIEYKNMEVEVLNNNDPDKSSGFLSLVSNSLVKRDNLRSQRNFNVADVMVERPTNKSFINYSLRGLKDGIMYTMVPVSKIKKIFKNNNKKKSD